MSEFQIRLSQSRIDPDERARRLARVYAYILSLPDRRHEINEIAKVDNKKTVSIEKVKQDTNPDVHHPRV